MESEYNRLRAAVFDRLNANGTWREIALCHGVTVMKLRVAFKAWSTQPPQAQPQSPRDIHFDHQSPGRPCMIPRRHELVNVEGIKHYADNNTPLTKDGVLDLVKQFLDLLPINEQIAIGFHKKNNRPSLRFCQTLMEHHGLEYKSVRMVEDNRVDAMNEKNIAKHIARVQAVMNRYNIKDPHLIFNMGQSGASFAKMVGRSLRKGVGAKGSKNLTQKSVSTKGSLD